MTLYFFLCKLRFNMVDNRVHHSYHVHDTERRIQLQFSSVHFVIYEDEFISDTKWRIQLQFIFSSFRN